MEEQDANAQPISSAAMRAGSCSCSIAPLSFATVLALSACGAGKSEELILPGGIPARTNLHEASTLPPESVRTVARRDYGWRLIYHPARAPASAGQAAARALCDLESRSVQRIENIPRIDPYADYGAAIIDIYCV
ncbi:hypothetical protein [Paracoccus onubensis]|nr:hypothetical protein [Paracoccus onubensis]